MSLNPHLSHHHFRHLPSALFLSIVTVAFPLVPGISDASRGGTTPAGAPANGVERVLKRPRCTPGFVCSGPGQRANGAAVPDRRAVLRLAMAMGATLR